MTRKQFAFGSLFVAVLLVGMFVGKVGQMYIDHTGPFMPQVRFAPATDSNWTATDMVQEYVLFQFNTIVSDPNQPEDAAITMESERAQRIASQGGKTFILRWENGRTGAQNTYIEIPWDGSVSPEQAILDWAKEKIERQKTAAIHGHVVLPDHVSLPAVMR